MTHTRTALLALALLVGTVPAALAQRDSSNGRAPEPREAAGGTLAQTQSSNGLRDPGPATPAGAPAQSQSSNGVRGGDDALPRTPDAPRQLAPAVTPAR